MTIYNLNRSEAGTGGSARYDRRVTDAVARELHRVRGQLRRAPARRGAICSADGPPTTRSSVACGGNDPNTFRYCDQIRTRRSVSSRLQVQRQLPAALGHERRRHAAELRGTPLTVNWTVPPNAVPGGRTQSVTVNLIPPGSEYLGSLDSGRPERSTSGSTSARYDSTRALDIYNLFNSNVVLRRTRTTAAACDQPQQVLQGRLLRVSTQVKF